MRLARRVSHAGDEPASTTIVSGCAQASPPSASPPSPSVASPSVPSVASPSVPSVPVGPVGSPSIVMTTVSPSAHSAVDVVVRDAHGADHTPRSAQAEPRSWRCGPAGHLRSRRWSRRSCCSATARATGTSKNLFTGWVDVDLTEKGVAEAARGGTLLVEHDLLPDVVHTSLQRRAIRTAELTLSTRPIGCGSRCAARGGSTSATTARCRARTRPRRSPSSARSSSCSGAAPTTRRRRRCPRTTGTRSSTTRATPRCRRRSGRARSASPTSSTACCRTGTTPSSPTCAPGRRVLVAAHGNSLRALIKHLDGMSEEDVVGLNVPDRHPAALRPRRRPATAHDRRRVPRSGGRRGGDRGRQEPGPALSSSAAHGAA